MNATTVLRGPNFTSHVFFKKNYGIAIFSWNDDFLHHDPPPIGEWASGRLRCGPGPRARHAPAAQNQKYIGKGQSLDFHESHVDIHMGSAELRGGIHSTQFVMVSDKIMILINFDTFFSFLGGVPAEAPYGSIF